MRRSNDQENDSAFKANMAMAVRERWGNSGARMGPCSRPALLQFSLVRWTEGGVLLIAAALLPATNIPTRFREGAAARQTSQGCARVGGPRLSHCIFICQTGCQSVKHWENACADASLAEYSIVNLGCVLLESHRCANHPGCDLEISRVEDADPRSGYASLPTATQNTRILNRVCITDRRDRRRTCRL